MCVSSSTARDVMKQRFVEPHIVTKASAVYVWPRVYGNR